MPFFDPTQALQIQSNQRGQLSNEQRAELETQSQFKIWPLLTPFVILPVIFVGIVVAVLYFDNNHEMPLIGFVLMVAFFAFIELIALISPVRTLIDNFRIKNDLAGGQVEILDGQCVWRRNKYVLETPARRLKLMRNSMHLMPGSYRFYALPNTGLLLSAQRQVPPGGEDPRAELLDVMGQVHHFKNEDLEANRQGRLVISQMGGLLWRVIGYSFFWVFSLGIGVIILYGLAQDSSPRGLMWLAVIGGVVFLAALALFVWVVGRVVLDMVRAKVVSAQGPVRRDFTITHSQHGSSTTYYYKLDKLSFVVSPQAYTAFIQGPQYRLYYTPLSKTLVAVEPI